MTEELKEKAISLRKEGMTYPEISSALDGAISVDWLKRNLKGIPKGDKQDSCLEELIQLATRPEGVSVYEANGVIMNHNKENPLSKDQIRYIRTRAKARNPSCLFRPAWMSTKAPADSFQSFCAYILHMQDEIDNLVRWYCDSYPDTNPDAVKYELIEYLKPESRVAGRIDKAEKMIEALEQRKQIE